MAYEEEAANRCRVVEKGMERRRGRMLLHAPSSPHSALALLSIALICTSSAQRFL